MGVELQTGSLLLFLDGLFRGFLFSLFGVFHAVAFHIQFQNDAVILSCSDKSLPIFVTVSAKKGYAAIVIAQ